MTERFTITGHRSISDHQKKRLYDLNNFDGIISINETLNELVNDNNELQEEVKDYNDTLARLTRENEQLKQRLQKIQDSFEFNWTQNYMEYDKDTLHIKDNNTEIRLNGTNLFIEVYIPQIKEYYRFKYIVTGRSLMKEFIENYNSKEEDDD